MTTAAPSGGAMEEERKRKRVFWSTFFASYAGVVLAFWGLMALMRLVLQAPSRSTPFPVMPLAAFALFAWQIAGGMCRRRGLSRESRTSEVLKRGGPARELGVQGVVEVPAPRWPWVALGSLLAVPAVGICALILWLDVKGVEQVGGGSAYAAAGVFGLASLACWARNFGRGRLNALADDAGVLRRSLLGDHRVSWDQVAEVGVHTERNVFGKPARTVCHFRDHSGRTLLTLSLEFVPEEARDRFIEAIRAKQGLPPGKRTELEAAEAPEGTGLEPEAAPAPAGRGTEPEAAGRAR